MISGATTTEKHERVGDERASVAARRCSVVIVGYQGEKWLPECLSSLARSSNDRLHLVLVDNGGNGDLNRLPLADFDAEVIQTPHAMGFADANNYGLVHGRLDADTVCFLNQDTVGDPGWIDACLECLDGDPKLGAVSPLLKTWDAADWDEGFWQCARLSSEFRRDNERGKFADCYAAPQVSAAAMVVRTSVLRSVGPFDPVFGSYFEDYDLCRRIREAGFEIAISGQGVVRHFGGSASITPAQQRKRTRQLTRNRAIHRIRGAGSRRVSETLLQFGRHLPWNLARGIVRTDSSQPPTVQLSAHYDLARIVWRLLSARHDRAVWQRYLQQIGWPGSGANVSDRRQGPS